MTARNAASRATLLGFVVRPRREEDVQDVAAGVADLAAVDHRPRQVKKVALAHGRRPVEDELVDRAAENDHELFFGMEVGGEVHARAHLKEAELGAAAADQPGIRPGLEFGELDVVEIANDAGPDRRSDRERRLRELGRDALRPGQLQVIRPRRPIDLDDLGPVRPGLDGVRRTLFEIDELVLGRPAVRAVGGLARHGPHRHGVFADELADLPFHDDHDALGRQGLLGG